MRASCHAPVSHISEQAGCLQRGHRRRPESGLRCCRIDKRNPGLRAGLLSLAGGLLFLAQTVSAAEDKKRPKWPYADDLKAFVDEMDRTYPFFDVKGIRKDWEKTKRSVLKRAKTCETDQTFFELLIALGRCLRDAHLGPRRLEIKAKPPPPKYYPGVCFFPAARGRVIILSAREGLHPDLRPGTVVLAIDRKDARKVLEARAREAWREGGFFSSPQRARMLEYRNPLKGEKGEKHTITVLVGRKKKRISLTSDTTVRGWLHTYNMPDGLTQVGRCCRYGKLPSGVGYIYLRQVDGSTGEGIEKAVETHPDVKGWIVDLRGNGGGGYGAELQQKLGTLKRPVACLIDAGCMSAGETLARDIVRACDARLFGSRTGGASSAKRIWNFPSGVGAVSVPTRSRWGVGGRAIEFFGIEPHVEVEAEPEEVQQGLNSCLLRAEEFICGTSKKTSRRRR